MWGGTDQAGDNLIDQVLPQFQLVPNALRGNADLDALRRLAESTRDSSGPERLFHRAFGPSGGRGSCRAWGAARQAPRAPAKRERRRLAAKAASPHGEKRR